MRKGDEIASDYQARGGRHMSRFSPYYCWFRSEIWALIEDCRSCELGDCPNWCKEFVELQMDEILDTIISAVQNGGQIG